MVEIATGASIRSIARKLDRKPHTVAYRLTTLTSREAA